MVRAVLAGLIGPGAAEIGHYGHSRSSVVLPKSGHSLTPCGPRADTHVPIAAFADEIRPHQFHHRERDAAHGDRKDPVPPPS